MSEPDTAPRQYQVLARKYRPASFSDLIGQEAMVRTLSNAFATNRIAHAFILTGVRGVGKTTTARIVAKGLNCTGADGQGGPTIAPCGQCEACVSIAEGRHVDVLEMDAASRTGVGDIREIIDSVRYRATSARYKVYIIDEVHMLSTSAFNALLKTLEEPPEHVKFLFATTEIRKVPVTVLSRCQRFDLRRIEPEVMIAHLAGIAGKEGVEIEEAALAMIARAAEGSVRDALSLLDQAIAHGQGRVDATQVRAMLGLADRGRVMDLFDMVMRGDAAGALQELSAQYAEGADPVSVLRDLAEVTHWVSLVKITPEAAEDPTVSPAERDRGRAMAADLSLRGLTRMWQMCLKALEEVSTAPSPMMAAEMAIIRMTHVSELPTPGDLVRKLQDAPPLPQAHAPQASAPGAGPRARQAAPPRATHAPAVPGGAAVAQPAPVAASATYPDFDAVVDLIRARRDMRLLVEVENHLRLVHYAPGRIEFQPTGDAPSDLAARLSRQLQAWTDMRWGVSVVSDGGGETIAETRAARRTDMVGQAMRHPMMQAVLASFPGVTDAHVSVHEPVQADPGATQAPIEDPAEEFGEDWDPLDAFD
ncbi:DNA polymerase III subunit gamma/tau [Halovulum dunhuangense]|uniref:DNA polymerase III subunit gamma/tau n=1 Tax=Halovulum dunhuangense TaxID=1505036 RepID=A0A849L5P6_9RHOB|nr:DNA polymerase III subunit gamma/tau [Halovulum dunhuangense]NNU81484.1 DNA polymerase III subunit gamma/tau [Halovulum dunhuangense]